MPAPQGPPSRTSPLMIGLFLGLGLFILFLLSTRGGDNQPSADPQPWRVLTINNSAINRRSLPIRVICPLPQGANPVSHPTADCYFRASMEYNPADDVVSGSDCQLAGGFVTLVVGIGEEAVSIPSQPVDLVDTDGNCSLSPGVTVDAMFAFKSTPHTEKLSLIRFVSLEPQLELSENLRFVIDKP